MAERPCDALYRVCDFKGWVTIRLNFKLKMKGYVSRQYLYGPLVGLYYKFAAGSFHTKKLCGRLYSIEIEFY